MRSRSVSSLRLSELGKTEEELLTARLRAARAAVEHAGEKGRALEHEASALLRSFLPAEYGLSTGFIAHHGKDGPLLSKQLDIIIYDAIRGGPLLSLRTCDVFPIESVFGYVEVKTCLTSGSSRESSIERCLEDNAKLRKMTDRHFRMTGLQVTTVKQWLPIRAYIIAFETSKALRPAMKLGQRLANAAKKTKDGHVHGIYAGGSGFAAMRAINPAIARPSEWYHSFATHEHSVLAFKAGVLRGLASFPRTPPHYAPALDPYFDFEPSLVRYAPESAEDDSRRQEIVGTLNAGS